MEFVNPKSLLSIGRLDIILKYLYITEYINKNSNSYLKLYKKHIELRTGNIEDKKTNSNDFVESFNHLIDSIKVNGFDAQYTIDVSVKNKFNLTGAHRLACALYFELEIPVNFLDEDGLSWDAEWFGKYRFEQDVIDELIYTYSSLKNNVATFILWNAVSDVFDEITDELSKYTKIIYQKNIKLPKKDDVIELVNDIYAYEFGPLTSQTINDKAVTLAGYPVRVFRLVIVEYENESDVLKVKDRIREQTNKYVNKNLYLTIHSSDNAAHSNYLNELFLSKNNLNRLVMRGKASAVMSPWLDEFYTYILKSKFNIHDVCIVGSSSMDVMGIRESTDIDFILISQFRDKLYTSSVHQLTTNIDLAASGYLRLAGSDVNDDVIINQINNHFIYKGFKFIDLTHVLMRKEKQCRAKDILDVKLIKEWEQRKKQPISQLLMRIKFVLWFYFLAKPRVLKTRVKHYLRKKLPEPIVSFIKRVLGR
jgi:hypothetical protein